MSALGTLCPHSNDGWILHEFAPISRSEGFFRPGGEPWPLPGKSAETGGEEARGDRVRMEVVVVELERAAIGGVDRVGDGVSLDAVRTTRFGEPVGLAERVAVRMLPGVVIDADETAARLQAGKDGRRKLPQLFRRAGIIQKI